jgi:hypothetical protein
MDAALQINPYYGKTSTAGILAHFAAVLDYGRVGLSTALHSLTPRAPSWPGSSSHLTVSAHTTMLHLWAASRVLEVHTFDTLIRMDCCTYSYMCVE